MIGAFMAARHRLIIHALPSFGISPARTQRRGNSSMLPLEPASLSEPRACSVPPTTTRPTRNFTLARVASRDTRCAGPTALVTASASLESVRSVPCSSLSWSNNFAITDSSLPMLIYFRLHAMLLSTCTNRPALMTKDHVLFATECTRLAELAYSMIKLLLQNQEMINAFQQTLCIVAPVHTHASCDPVVENVHEAPPLGEISAQNAYSPTVLAAVFVSAITVAPSVLFP